MPILPLITFLRRVVAVIDPPRWYLDTTLLASGEADGVILQDPDPIHPGLPVEVLLQAISCVRGS